MLIDDYINYQNIYEKKYGKKTIILMQVGSFFEIYGIDNNTINFNIEKLYKICDLMNIQISKKNKNIKEITRTNPLMAGFPLVAVDKFIQILLNNNYTVVLIEQVTPPPEPERKVTNIYSPGTNIEYCNNHDSSNLVSIYIESFKDIQKYKNIYCVGLSNIDLTTGKSIIYECFSEIDDNKKIYDEIYRFIKINNPKEIIINLKNINKEINKEKLINDLDIEGKIYHINDDINKDVFKLSYQKQYLEKIYNNTSLLSIIEYLDLERMNYGLLSFIFLLQFAYEHNENIIKNIDKPVIWDKNTHLILTNDSINQLDIINYNKNTKYSSLFNILNNTSTAIGKRYFKEKLLNPINNITKLNNRYSIIEELIKINRNNNTYNYLILEEHLKKVIDIERLQRKLSLKLLQPCDFCNMNISYLNILKIFNMDIFSEKLNFLLPKLKDINNFKEFINEYTTLFNMEEIMKYNLNTVNNSFFNKGQIEELDILKNDIDIIKYKLNEIANKLSYYIEKKSNYIRLEHTEKEGYYFITTKKRGEVLNKVFKNLKWEPIKIKLKNETIGMDIKKLNIKFLTNSCKISSDYLLELTNKLIKLEMIIKEKTVYYYLKYLDIFYIKYNDTLKEIIKFVGKIDFYKSNSKNAIIYKYNKPEIIKKDNSFIEVKDIRHPIIEQIQTDLEYVANDINLGNDLNGILLYGCNAVGKSSLMKAIGINIIMAQTGMFVPSSSFKYSPFDYIFTRINNNDNLFKGLSSFAVEMSELRNILKRSNNKSIILGDELCSGTESISALSIFSASVIKLSEKKANFIFATHLHELSKIDEINNLNNIKSFHLKVIFDSNNKKLIYDRKLTDGNGPTTYGLEVCKAMELDNDFLKLAETIRKKITNTDLEILDNKKSHFNKDLYFDKCKICNDKCSEIHHIKEQNMADKNNFIDHTHKNNLSNLVPLCYDCHQKVHHGNLQILGYKLTNFGRELIYNYIDIKDKKSKKKYNLEQIEIILSYKSNNNYTQSSKLLLEEYDIKISKNTIKKIWQNQY